MRALLLVALGAALAGCVQTAGPEATGSDSQAIIGGTTDPGDPAVVLLYIVDGMEASLCTASVIAPRVLLTAAHCVSDKMHTANAKYQVFLGADFAQATQATLLPVLEVHAQPAWDPLALEAGHDVGIVILAAPVSITPLPMRRTPITNVELGKPLRLVGYGASNGTTKTGSGLKRQTETPIDSYDDVTIQFSDTMHLTCNGDSGGPALVVQNGVEEIAGITSYGDEFCQQFGANIRVDAELAFIDPFLARFAAAPAPSRTISPAAFTRVDDSVKSDSDDVTAVTRGGDLVQGGCSVTATPARLDLGVLVIFATLLARLLARRRA